MLEILIDCDLKVLPSFVCTYGSPDFPSGLSMRTKRNTPKCESPRGFLTKAKSAPSAEFLRLLERLSPLTAENFSALSGDEG